MTFEMKNLVLILILFLSLNSCKSSKVVVSKDIEPVISSKTESEELSPNDNDDLSFEFSLPIENNISLADKIIDYAKAFDGVKYKYGGNTKKGMDCSGLVTKVFKSEEILLPRRSKDMATFGNKIEVDELQKGDLLFFSTIPNKREISHVGLVTEVRPGFIEFIHATTKAGVIISNLAERYWYFAFVQARRIL